MREYFCVASNKPVLIRKIYLILQKYEADFFRAVKTFNLLLQNAELDGDKIDLH